MSQLRLHIEQQDQTAIIRCVGRLTLDEEAQVLRKALRDVMQPQVIIDLSQVSQIDGSGIGVLVEAARARSAQQRSLRIGPSTPFLCAVFEVVGLRSILLERAELGHHHNGYWAESA